MKEYTGNIEKTERLSYMTKLITAEKGHFITVGSPVKTLLKIKNINKRYTWQINGQPGINTILIKDFTEAN